MSVELIKKILENYEKMETQNERMEADLEGLEEENERLRGWLEESLNALGWWGDNYPEGLGKEDEDHLEKYRAFLQSLKEKE